MTIFRGGKRIGPFDLRIGLPRGREYDNIPGDPRLQQRANPETTINRFRAAISKGEGVARTNRFLVRISTPPGDKIRNVLKTTLRENVEAPSQIQGATQALDQYNQEVGREIGMMCESITMPGRTFRTEPYRQYGPSFNYPINVEYQPIQATFIGDKFLRMRQFFEAWQDLIFDNKTNNMNYYDEYTTPMDIFQLGSFDELNDRDSVTYGCRLFEVYPVSIDPIAYSYGDQNQYVKINVTFSYRYWLNFNLDIDSTGKVGGLSSGVVKPGQGTGIPFVDNLPPELKRTGRNAFNTLKRSIPIGKVFGGKVFPPFTF